MIDIRNSAGVKLSVLPSPNDRHYKELMVGESISLNFSLATFLALKKGDFIQYNGKTYTLNEDAIPEHNLENGGFDYSVHFYSIEKRFEDYIVFYTQNGLIEPKWKLTASGQSFLQVIINNISGRGLGAFTIGECPTDIVSMEFDGNTIKEALDMCAERYNMEWWLNGNTINLGFCAAGTAVSLTLGQELENITVSDSSEKQITRLYAFGSTRNLPSDYRGAQLVNDISEKRLRLPIGTNYVDVRSGLTSSEIVEGFKVFDEIYPRRTGTITAIRSRVATSQDGTQTTIYYFKDAGITFYKQYILSGETLKVTFMTGNLSGREFEIGFNETEQEYEIIYIQEGVVIPNPTLCPAVGDQYVLHGFDISFVSSSYVPAAESELLAEVVNYLESIGLSKVYNGKTRSLICRERDKDLDVGSIVAINSDSINVTSTRVMKFDKKLDDYFDCNYTFGDNPAFSRLKSIEDKLKHTEGADINSLKNIINSTFKDGIITAAESSRLKNSLENFKREKASLESSYEVVHGNEKIKESFLEDLFDKKELYLAAYNALVSSINRTIQDSIITETESKEVSDRLTEYSDALAAYRTSEETAKKSITDTIGKTLDSWTADGVISPLEKIAIKQTKGQVLAEKESIVSDAIIYGVPTLDYVSMWEAYDAVLAKYSADEPETIQVEEDFATTESGYRTAKVSIQNAIANKNKATSDYFKIDQYGNLYVTRNFYSTMNISAFGIGEEAEGTGGAGGDSGLNLYNGLDSSQAGAALDAYQGYLLKGMVDQKAPISHSHSWSAIADKPSVFMPETHTHSKSQIPDFSHSHDDRYYTETEIGYFFSGAMPISGYAKSNWDTAYQWGNHYGLYLGLYDKAYDSYKLDGKSSSYFQAALINPITGLGTAGYISRFSAATALTNSPIYVNGAKVDVGFGGTRSEDFAVNGTTYAETAFKTGLWEIKKNVSNSTILEIRYNGILKVQIDSSGNITTVGNLVGFSV